MYETAQILRSIKLLSSSLDKQHVLEQHKRNSRLQAVLKFIYNPYFKTGISDAKLDKAPIYPGYPVPNTPEEIMEYLKNHNTGDTETCGIVNTWLHTLDTAEERWLARGIITQKLQIGVQSTTLNKVFGSNFISKISCMLGTPIDKVPISKQRWPYIVTEKLDGVRRIMLKQNGSIKFYSRSGHEDTGLVDIAEEAKYLPDNYAYDGELLAYGTFSDSIAQRQSTNSIANSGGEKHGVTFNIFDMVPINDFLMGFCAKKAIDRKKLLAAVFSDDSAAILYNDAEEATLTNMALSDGYEHTLIRPVPILSVAYSMEDVTPVVNALWSAGREGVMLNDTVAGYEQKRTKALIKMKKTETYVLRIEGFAEGTGKYEDALGALITEYKDCHLQVGSGFTDSERYIIWDNQDDYIGRLFEVEAFGESTNRQGLVSLNCPIFKRML